MTEAELKEEQRKLARELVRLALHPKILSQVEVQALEEVNLRLDSLNRGAYYLRDEK